MHAPVHEAVQKTVGSTTAVPPASPYKVTSREQLLEMLQKPQQVPARLGDLLLDLDVLKPEQRDVALQLQQHHPDKRLGEVLTELGMLRKDALYRALCEKLGVPYVDVERFNIDPNALKALPDALLRTDHVLPLCFQNGVLVVAMPDVLDSALVNRVRFLADCPVTPVLSTADEIDRVLGTYMGIDPFSFSDSLLAVLAQRLVRRLCLACRVERPADGLDIEELAAEYCYGYDLDPAAVIEGWRERHGASLRTYRATGCAQCRESGYRGRIGVYELLTVPPEMRPMMLHHAAAADLQRLAMKHGMRTLKQDGIEKCLQGLTDLREVHAVAM